jgi:hypothetical protein
MLETADQWDNCQPQEASTSLRDPEEACGRKCHDEDQTGAENVSNKCHSMHRGESLARIAVRCLNEVAVGPDSSTHVYEYPKYNYCGADAEFGRT